MAICPDQEAHEGKKRLAADTLAIDDTSSESAVQVQYGPANKKVPDKNKMLAFGSELRKMPYERDLVLATQIRKSNMRKSNIRAEVSIGIMYFSPLR